jgi:hypothetical protein
MLASASGLELEHFDRSLIRRPGALWLLCCALFDRLPCAWFEFDQVSFAVIYFAFCQIVDGNMHVTHENTMTQSYLTTPLCDAFSPWDCSDQL